MIPEGTKNLEDKSFNIQSKMPKLDSVNIGGETKKTLRKKLTLKKKKTIKVKKSTKALHLPYDST